MAGIHSDFRACGLLIAVILAWMNAVVSLPPGDVSKNRVCLIGSGEPMETSEAGH
jgi:hypothetical protein